MEMNEFKVPQAVPRIPPKTVEPHTTSTEENASGEKNALKRSATCPYKEPKWSGRPPTDVVYKFEILKAGQIIGEVRNLQKKAFWIFGRLPRNDVEMAHPTVSRFHSILQYRPKIADDEKNEKQIEEGWYIYDMGSTHGTFLNKMRIPSKTYIRVKVGHMLRLGASTRYFILQGPESDEEPESELSVTELKQMRANIDEQKKKDALMQQEAKEKEGISWGMGEDAEEESDLSVNPYATTNNEELFLDDPKKTLRGFFEREGLDLEYKCDEMSVGTFVCRIELPVDDLNGKQIVAEVCHKGKKKECVVQCALEACRILDRHGVLRQAHHEPLKRKVTKADSDDDDDFFDRTGDVERKRYRKTYSRKKVVLKYDDLLSQESAIMEKIKQVQENIVKLQELAKQIKASRKQEFENLEEFMASLSEEVSLFHKVDVTKLRIEEKQLRLDLQKTKKLIEIAKPLDLPPITNTEKADLTIEPTVTNTEKADPTIEPTVKKPRQLPIIGKRNQFSFKTLQVETMPTKDKTVEKELKSDEEEIDEEEDRAESSTSAAKESPQESSKNQSIEKESQLEEKVVKENSKKLYGPAFIPKDIKEECSVEEKMSVDAQVSEKKSPIYEDSCSKELSTSLDNNEGPSSSKKKRTRQRIRGRRENVDIDDQGEYEDTEKYSKWIPPDNQSGDGITSLNDKFGY